MSNFTSIPAGNQMELESGFKPRFPHVFFEVKDTKRPGECKEFSTDSYVAYVAKLRGAGLKVEVKVIDENYEKCGGNNPSASLEEKIFFTAEHMERKHNHYWLLHLAEKAKGKKQTSNKNIISKEILKLKRRLDNGILFGIALSKKDRRALKKADRVIRSIERRVTLTLVAYAIHSVARFGLLLARRVVHSDNDRNSADSDSDCSDPLSPFSWHTPFERLNLSKNPYFKPENGQLSHRSWRMSSKGGHAA